MVGPVQASPYAWLVAATPWRRSRAARETLTRLEPTLPPGVKIIYPYDTAPVVSASINGVVHTLVEAIVLVFLIMYLFLQTGAPR